MSTITSLAISVSVFGGIATWLFLSLGSILIWGAFLAWACFYHSGGDEKALKSTLICNNFGVVVAWTTALVISAVPLGDVLGATIWPALAVAVSIAIYILAANIPIFSSIPGTTYGYAGTFAYLLQTPDRFTVEALTTPGFINVLVVLPVSMIIGAFFAIASAKFANVMKSAAPAPK